MNLIGSMLLLAAGERREGKAACAPRSKPPAELAACVQSRAAGLCVWCTSRAVIAPSRCANRAVGSERRGGVRRREARSDQRALVAPAPGEGACRDDASARLAPAPQQAAR